MKKFVRNNYKLLIGIIIGVILSVTGVYAATILYNSNAVGFDNTSSGMEATNVQDAIDELYTDVNSGNLWLKKYKRMAVKPTNYIFDGTNLPTTASPTTPPSGKNVYLGLYEDEQIGVCIKRNGKEHCFRYNNWIAEAKHLEELCSETNDYLAIDPYYVTCSASDIEFRIYSNGNITGFDKNGNGYCDLTGAGNVNCYL